LALCGRSTKTGPKAEIADYPGCDERTCLRREKGFGLPIHRIEGAKKSRVYAYRDEIDRWQREKSVTVWSASAAIVPAALLLTA